MTTTEPVKARELEIEADQILKMVKETARQLYTNSIRLSILVSDSYGPHSHRTWLFYDEGREVLGSIERYWGGLKMICSVHGGSPRTTFFTEDGIKTTNKGLKGQ